MNIDELRTVLTHLIDRYVDDADEQQNLRMLVARDEVPAKGILVQLTPWLGDNVSAADSALIGEIAFYFC